MQKLALAFKETSDLVPPWGEQEVGELTIPQVISSGCCKLRHNAALPTWWITYRTPMLQTNFVSGRKARAPEILNTPVDNMNGAGLLSCSEKEGS